MLCDDVNTCHFQKVSFFFSKSIATWDIFVHANVKQYDIKAEENYAPNHKLSRHFEITKYCGYLEYKVKVIKIG